MTFKRSIGPVGLMFTAVSGILGSGWLFGPYYAAQLAGPAALLAWVFAFFSILLIAMTFAELACMFPISGGSARFMHFTHGSLTSFIFSWVLYLGYAAVPPIETMGVLQYLASVYPVLVKKSGGLTVLSLEGYLAAALILLLMCVINLQSVKWLSRYNSVIVWFKLIVPLVIIVSLLWVSFHLGNFYKIEGGVFPSGFNGMASALTNGGIILSFVGFAPVIVLAGEAKNPQKVIPLVLLGALGICLLIYFLLQVAFIGALSPAHIAQGWSQVHFSLDSSPFVGLASELGLNHLKLLVFLIAIIAPLGTALIFITTSARVAHAMSENGFLPNMFKTLSKRGVPSIAIGLNFVIGMLLFFPAPGWQGMVSFLVSAFVLCYAIGPIALLSLRQNYPEGRRVFKLKFAKLFSYLAFTISNLLVYWTGWVTVWHMLVAVLLGLVILTVMRIFKSEENLNLKNSLWVFIYLPGLGLISYLGQFGGIGLIPKYFDLLVMAIFSGVILILACLQAFPKAQLPEGLLNLKEGENLV